MKHFNLTFLSTFLCAGLFALIISGCSESPPPAPDTFIIGGGMIVLDTKSAGTLGYSLTDSNDQSISGVSILQSGQTVTDPDNLQTSITGPVALSAFDANRDTLIDAADPVWNSLHLAVDYNGDGVIDEGEYALIGECGVEALKTDPANNELLTLHTNGETSIVTTVLADLAE